VNESADSEEVLAERRLWRNPTRREAKSAGLRVGLSGPQNGKPHEDFGGAESVGEGGAEA
jgi:hypothetical protein